MIAVFAVGYLLDLLLRKVEEKVSEKRDSGEGQQE